VPTLQRNVVPEDGGSTFLRNVGTQSKYYTAQQTRRSSLVTDEINKRCVCVDGALSGPEAAAFVTVA
jgi:hypothetical protein